MYLDQYINFIPTKKSSKRVHIHNDKTSGGSNLQIQSDSGSNYQFLTMPVDTNKTEPSDFWYIIHCDSGLPVGVNGNSKSSGADVEIQGWDHLEFNESLHWSFRTNSDNHTEITNRRSGLQWKLASGETSNKTPIRQGNADGSSTYLFDIERVGLIPGSSLASDCYRSDVTLNSKAEIPQLTSTTQALDNTDPVLIGHSCMPFYMVSESRNSIEQLKESPYYLMERYQYWDPKKPTTYAAGTSVTYTNTIEYGVTESNWNSWTQVTDWSISAELNVGYGNVSGGVSTSFAESMEVASGSESTSYDVHTSTTSLAYDTLKQETLFVTWQLVNEFVIKDADGSVVKTMAFDSDNTVMQTFPEINA